MAPISFNVGPSALWPELPQWAQNIFSSGILSRSHRSPAFEALYRRIQHGFEEKHLLPEGYRVFLLSSATECWQVLADALGGTPALHLHSGAFGKRWHAIAEAQNPEPTTGIAFDFQAGPTLPAFASEMGLIALTHNETSNGSRIPFAFLEETRKAAPGALLAVDATSSLGGVTLPYSLADIWFASVQKCLGLPAGLAVLIASPNAQAWIQTLTDSGRYNDLKRIHTRGLSLQTTHTPNVLGIALLAEMLANTPALKELDAHTARIRTRWDGWLADPFNQTYYQPLVADPTLRSDTVLALRPTFTKPAALQAAATEAGYLLANGYGPWKADTFRIANFPALPEAAHAELQTWLTDFAATATSQS